MTIRHGATAIIALTVLHLLIFVGFFSQEILIDSSGCDVSCGNLLVDLVLLFMTPVSWLVAVGVSIAAFVKAPQLRRVTVICWIVLLIPVLVFIGSVVYLRSAA
ncbi:hypothetical protein BH10ACT5_BH10ACT5_00090 [soil metagenome]